MAETIKVEIVTPERVLFSGEADLIEAPGADGDFGVLPQHSPLVALLREGAVRLYQNGYVTDYPVAGGLAQVDAEKCVILAEQNPE